MPLREIMKDSLKKWCQLILQIQYLSKEIRKKNYDKKREKRM